MKFNKYLAMCFLASTLMCGSFTSCGDDDDDDPIENGKSTVEQGRADGKKFGEDYKVVMGSGDSAEKTGAALTMISAASKYKNSTDNTYKTAFAEAAIEVITGKQETGDAAVEKLNAILEGLTGLEDLKNQLTKGNTDEKAAAIAKIMDLVSSMKGSTNA